MNVLENSSIKSGFDSVFTELLPEGRLSLKNNNFVRLFYLNISSNKFTYDGIHSILQRNIGRYVFSRAKIEQLKAGDDADAIGLKAIELLKSVSNRKDKGAGGELGEILLYLFLENKLDAPKLLSKVELKTSNNQYVFGSDGVHLLCVKNKTFQLVFGESKVKGKLKDAIDDAFESILKVSKDSANELRLIESNILSETFDEKAAAFIKSLVVPSKRDPSINVDNAFGIFVGYTLGICADNLSNSEFRSKVTKKLQEDIVKNIPQIEKHISASGLSGYSFYFFLLPFNDAEKDRVEIITRLKGLS